MKVSWTDDNTRRHLHRLIILLAVLAVAGHYASPWFGL